MAAIKAFLLAITLLAFTVWINAAEPAKGPVSLQRTATGVAFFVALPHDGVSLRVATPNGTVFERDFKGFGSPSFSLTDERGLFRGDGQYMWEVRLTPLLGPSAKREMQEARDRGDEATLSDLSRLNLPPYPLVYSGTFRVERGSVLYDPYVVEPTGASVSKPPLPPPDPAAEGRELLASANDPQPLDVVYADDLILQGSLCTGIDCVNGETFGFDTFRLKENNLRIHFDDTSATAGFPANDWRFIANDSASGGANYLAIEDSATASQVFRVTAGAPANSLFVSSVGRVGVKTATPAQAFHIADGNTPGVRLDQDASGGWTPQIWDVAGNEANFFIRDVTGGSDLCFRIQPGAPTNTLALRADGKVGIGTWAPVADLEVYRTGAEASLLLNPVGGTPWLIGSTANGVILNPGTTTSSHVFQLGATGDLLLSGVLTQGSSREIKSGCAAFGPDLLDAISQLPVFLWSYTADASGTRHASPMAEDFFRLFGLGADDRHLAPSDLAGVTLAAVQELLRSGQEKDAQIAALQRRNDELSQRLARLEEVVFQSSK